MTDQLQAVADVVATALDIARPGVPAIRSFPSGAAELLKTFDGVEYKIRISAFTLQEKGKIAKASLGKKFLRRR